MMYNIITELFDAEDCAVNLAEECIPPDEFINAIKKHFSCQQIYNNYDRIFFYHNYIYIYIKKRYILIIFIIKYIL
jgi:hypothetical protein